MMTKIISHVIVFIIFTLIVLFVLVAFITYPLWFWKVDTKTIEAAINNYFRLREIRKRNR